MKQAEKLSEAAQAMAQNQEELQKKLEQAGMSQEQPSSHPPAAEALKKAMEDLRHVGRLKARS